ncbi:snRNA-activating protein of 50kDa MW C terminal-domain-containing protein [Helicostylum pulchrum]|nr:snRNA-activating protein of 50kDa MW C terminal-domain-containing protein [Helicostylum pulchrum]
MTTPNQLKESFREVFERQRLIETDPEFIKKRKRYENIDLKSKHDLATLSEIFQDPELLSSITSDVFSLQALKEKDSRRRYPTKKPQAKDVIANRVIPDEELEKILSLEHQNEKSRKRRQDTEEEEDGSGRKKARDGDGSNSESDQESVSEVSEQMSQEKGKGEQGSVSSSTPSESNLSQTTTPINVYTLNLALPSACVNESTDKSNEPEEEEEFPLAKALKETAALYKESVLKSIGPKYLYTLLPRQCEINAYKFVKEDYNPSNVDIEDERDSLDDTLITITIYDASTTAKKFQEIEILGSQRVSDFRDAVYCLSDFVMKGDRLGKNADGQVINTLEKKLSPSMIYMDHVFYVDTRLEAHGADYYDDLIDSWLAKKGVNKSVFAYTKKNMDVLFQDIALNLHKPVAFIHQDKCEHMLMVQSVRLIANNEFRSKDEFPRTTYNLRYVRFKCSMCTIFPATKMTEEEIISGFSPCYYCDNCFESFRTENTTVVEKEYYGTRGGHIKKKQSKE